VNALAPRTAVLLAALSACTVTTSVGRADDRYETCDPSARDAYAEAQRAILSGTPADALPHLRRVVELSPDFVPAHIQYQDVARELGGAAEESMRTFYAAWPADSSSPVGPFLKARLAPSDEDRMKGLERAIENDDSFYFAYQLQAEFWIRYGRTSNALELLQKAFSSKPDYAPANIALAEILESLGRGAEARRHYENYVEVRPGDLQARKALVELLIYGLGEPSEAKPHLARLRQIDVDDVEVLMDTAAVAWLEGDLEVAADTYRDVLKRDAGRSRAILNLGNLYYDAFPNADPERREEYWKKAQLAYRLYVQRADYDGFYDLWDAYFALAYRLEEIAELVGPLADDVDVQISDL
jgi:Flp pilus assembly protein TadD